MLSTFIKNKGISKTIIHKNNKNYYNEMNWDADYDGEKANISLDIDDNGSKGHVEMKINNDELSEILNIPTVNKTIDKRLYSDFLTRTPKHIEDDKIIQIYIKPKPILHDNNFNLVKHKKKVRFDDNSLDNDDEINSRNELVNTIENLIDPSLSEQKYTHISSPASQEEIIFPLIVANKRTRRHHRKKPKSHVTYKVHRKHKSSPLNSSKKKNSKSHHHYSRRTF
jgi:hypothetical protein